MKFCSKMSQFSSFNVFGLVKKGRNYTKHNPSCCTVHIPELEPVLYSMHNYWCYCSVNFLRWYSIGQDAQQPRNGIKEKELQILQLWPQLLKSCLSEIYNRYFRNYSFGSFLSFPTLEQTYIIPMLRVLIISNYIQKTNTLKIHFLHGVLEIHWMFFIAEFFDVASSYVYLLQQKQQLAMNFASLSWQWSNPLV